MEEFEKVAKRRRAPYYLHISKLGNPAYTFYIDPSKAQAVRVRRDKGGVWTNCYVYKHVLQFGAVLNCLFSDGYSGVRLL